jgi:hypothetical protein
VCRHRRGDAQSLARASIASIARSLARASSTTRGTPHALGVPAAWRHKPCRHAQVTCHVGLGDALSTIAGLRRFRQLVWPASEGPKGLPYGVDLDTHEDFEDATHLRGLPQPVGYGEPLRLIVVPCHPDDPLLLGAFECDPRATDP